MFVSLQGRFVFLHNPPSGNVKLEGGVVFACEQSTPTYEELHVQIPFNTKLFILVKASAALRRTAPEQSELYRQGVCE